MSPTLSKDLLRALTELPAESVESLLLDLLTPAEVETLNERWAIACALLRGESQRAIAEQLGASVTTVSRGNRQLKYGHGGFATAADLVQGGGEP